MSAFRTRRSEAGSEPRQRLAAHVPWRFVPLICLAILAGVWAGSAWAEERPAIENSIGMRLVSIPAGEFIMGATEKEIARLKYPYRGYAKKELEKAAGDSEKQEQISKELGDALELVDTQGPQHRVVITKLYFLGQCEVTQQEFSAVMGWNASFFSATRGGKKIVEGMDTSRHPVEAVSWEDAVEFCRLLSALPEEAAAGRTYRLPTEAEWEYACRAGRTTSAFWGDDPDRDHSLAKEYAWGTFNSDGHPHPVGQKRPNAWGLFDMLGNVGEWCADWYAPKAYAASPLRDPAGPSSGTERIVRGADFRRATLLVATLREKHPGRGATWGFRVACDVSAVTPPVVETTPAPSGMQDIEARLKEKGLTRRMGYFLLPEEAQFIRYTNTLERLRIACVHAQAECLDVRRQLDRVGTAKNAVVKARMHARARIHYSDTWRERWAAIRTTNQATDAESLVDLSKEDIQKWQNDAQDDLDSAVEFFGQQIGTLQEMFYKLQTQYRELGQDAAVKKALAEANAAGKASYRLGPTPSAAAAVKKLDREKELQKQFQRK